MISSWKSRKGSEKCWWWKWAKRWKCSGANTCQPGDAAVRGGQHTGAGWPVLSRFLFWLWKTLFFPEQWNWPKKPPPPNVPTRASPRRPRALLLYLPQLLCKGTGPRQCLQPSLQTDFTGYPTNHENVIYKQPINYPFAKKAESIRHLLGSLGQWNIPGWMGAAVDSSSHLPSLCLWDQKPHTGTVFILICLLFIFYFRSGTNLV